MEAAGTIRILAAEDNQTNQKVLAALLEPLNIDLTLVDNGRQAVELFKTAAFDVIFMDVQDVVNRMKDGRVV